MVILLNPYAVGGASGGGGGGIGGGAGGDPVLIATYTGTSVASAEIPIPSGYDRIRIVGKFKPATSSTEHRMRVTNDNFSTIESGSVYENTRRVQWSSSNEGVGGSGSETSVIIYNDFSRNDRFSRFTIDILGHDQAGTPTSFHSRGGHLWTTYGGGHHSTGRYKVNEVIDGIEFTPSSGNITEYEYRVIGFPSS